MNETQCIDENTSCYDQKIIISMKNPVLIVHHKFCVEQEFLSCQFYWWRQANSIDLYRLPIAYDNCWKCSLLWRTCEDWRERTSVVSGYGRNDLVDHELLVAYSLNDPSKLSNSTNCVGSGNSSRYVIKSRGWDHLSIPIPQTAKLRTGISLAKAITISYV